jgi:spermidine synthase
MAAEVVWFRQFTPFLGTFVYSFARVLALYLGATLLGSAIYRMRGGRARVAVLSAAVAPLTLLALVAADPTLDIEGSLRVPLGVVPFRALLGYLTPMLVDRWSAGQPDRAGRAYAVNALGCILGPLAAGFALLPALGPRGTLVAVAVPATAMAAWCSFRRPTPRSITASLLATAMACGLALATHDFEDLYPTTHVRRDHTATVIAMGEGMNKQLLVNGVGITILTPITKMMAHLPLAALRQPARRGLVICFGMGTTFRSMRSWGIPTTAVELVPSVPALFGYYHADGPAMLASPDVSVVIDDGRRFLERTSERFDVIVVDPPPPVEAASSSLLYSLEFYSAARRRMIPGGILQQWLPYGDPVTVVSVTRAIRESFPYVRAFGSIEGWGTHFLASDAPMVGLAVDHMEARLPAQAAADLTEWGPYSTARDQFAAVLYRERNLDELLGGAAAPALTDDRPVNEYFWVRRHF